MKKIALLIFTLSLVFGATTPTFAEGERGVIVHLFEREGCKHCEDEAAFLQALNKTDAGIQIKSHSLDVKEDKELFQKITVSASLPQVTPITFIEGFILQGFDTEKTTGEQIKNVLREVRKKALPLSLEDYLLDPKPKSVFDTEAFCLEDVGICTAEKPEFLVPVPFVGTLNLFDYSLPVLSVILGFVDGFNPCAMWALVIFLTILIEVGSRKKMWQLAGVFIFAEAIMYYLILNVWFTAWDFVGLDTIITPIVGVVAMGAGIFFLNEWRKGDTTCKVTGSETKKKTISRIRALVQSELTLATLAGVLFLAFSVNVIEFACSVGIPQAFTKILELNPLPFITKQFYMFLYIAMYMIDDLFIFGIALVSFERIGLTTKYTRFSHLVGGILMLILGILLTFSPETLVFF